eukprot:979909-Lingulodinium_polyedra.AAC.1
MVMSACVLEGKHLDSFEGLMQSTEFRAQAKIEQERAEALATPLPISAARRAVLESFPVYSRERPSMPRWVGAVAAARDFFADTILISEHEDGSKSYWNF